MSSLPVKVLKQDIGFPMRYSHSSREVCNLDDLINLKNLILGVIDKINNKLQLTR